MINKLTILAFACTAVVVCPATTRAQRRSAAPAGTVPMTSVTIAIGAKRYTGSVDAECGIDQRATGTNTRAYYRAFYPWFGQKVAADKPQWRFTLEIQRRATSDLYPHFTFSFLDGNKSATIQTVTYGERMGSGTVRVTRKGAGARFDLQGKSKEGDAISATITCPAFAASEAGGG